MTQPASEYQRIAEQQRRDQLVLTHLPLVKHIIGRLIGELPPGVDVENLESAGVLGLVEAAAKFDPTQNTQFKTFAFSRVRGAIHDEMRRNSMFPQHILERIAAIRKAYRSLPVPVTIATLANATGMTEDEVSDTLANIRMGRTISIDDVREAVSRKQINTEASPSAAMEQQELLQLLTEAIDALPERKRLLLVLYYREDTRLKEISEIVGLSVSRVSRMLTSSLFEIREYLRTRLELPSELPTEVPVEPNR